MQAQLLGGCRGAIGVESFNDLEVELHSLPDPFEVGPEEVINNTKKALIEGTPVSTGFFLPASFFNIKSDVWYTKPDDSLSDWKHAGHAMLVVGYDDNKAGGAFRVMNSWGTGWGESGYMRLSPTNSCGMKNYAMVPNLL